MGLKSRLPQIAASLEPRTKASMRAGAQRVAASARERVPVGDHQGVHLRDRIHVDEQPDGFYVVAGDDDAFYGHMVEYGTSHTAPRPFLVPALEENRNEIVVTVTATLRGL